MLALIIQSLVNGTPWPSGPGRSQECRTLVKEKSCLKIRNNLLYHVRTIGEGDPPEMQYQLVVPTTARKCILEHVNEKAGHMGQDRTMALLRLRCFWPGMASDVKEHVRDCTQCVWRKHLVNQVAPLQNVFTTQPMELVCRDYLTLETSKGGFENILVVTDPSKSILRLIPPGPKLPRWLLKFFTTISLCITNSPLDCTVTRGGILRVKSSRSCVSWVG